MNVIIRISPFLLCLLFLLAACCSVLGVPMTSAQPSYVRYGTADLTFADAPIQSVSLEGEWEWYANELLNPDQLALQTGKPSYIHVPEEKASRFKYGTYSLKLALLPVEIGRQKALYIDDIASAYKVWIDGKLLGGIGAVGASKEGETPQSRTKLLFFEPSSTQAIVVVQFSNFTFRSEGSFRAVTFGDADYLENRLIMNKLSATLTIGGLLVIGLYHLIIFGTRRRDLSTLFVGLFAVDIGLRGWIKDTYLVDLVAPFLSWESIVKLDYMTGYAAYLILVLIIKQMFPREMNRMAANLSHAFTVLFALYIAATPAEVYTKTLTYQFATMFLFSLYTIGYVCILAARRRRDGAWVNIVGYIGIAIACINDVLLYQRVIQTTEMLYEAIFLFVLLQAVLVSYRHSRLFDRNVALSNDLRLLNSTLEHKVADRTADLNRNNAELARMHRSRTEMLANISHDMGSPLTGIQMNMQLMKQGLVKADQQPEFVQSMLDKAAYIKRLNDDLFELSLLESGQLGFRFRRMEWRGCMDELVRKLKANLVGLGTDLQVGVMDTKVEDEEAWVRADPTRIMQALNNYVENAVKFSRVPGSAVIVNCRIASSENTHGTHSYDVIVEVQDCGPGIAEEDLPYVFDRFYRKAEGNANGSGLGLTIVREIVERHGGRVGVVSRAGEGSLFFFSLPAYPAAPPGHE
ncbi:sensor histidine kinase [Cohnella fermenti]|uniref:histidine kinase n=1 Tax=Cohnella fermenti TaxID=2565925 RepID=A0A4S4BMZ6_9BACL|nr:sensor histidine kinase [Cohnella fermenti]THF76231.1 hypothetical protein E6C55_19585 [Cohnella fermenti]